MVDRALRAASRLDGSEASAPNTTDGRVLTAIDAGARTVEELKIATELSHSGVYKALRRLHEAGLISPREPYERVRDSDPWGQS